MGWNEIAFRKSLQHHSQPVGQCDEKLIGWKSLNHHSQPVGHEIRCWDCLVVENHSSVTYLLKYNETTKLNQCNFTHTLLVRKKCDEMTWQKITSVTHKLLVMQLSAMRVPCIKSLQCHSQADGHWMVWEFPAQNHYSVTHSLLVMEWDPVMAENHCNVTHFLLVMGWDVMVVSHGRSDTHILLVMDQCDKSTWCRTTFTLTCCRSMWWEWKKIAPVSLTSYWLM